MKINLQKTRTALLVLCLMFGSLFVGVRVGEKRALKMFMPSSVGDRDIDLSLMWQVWDRLEDKFLSPDKLDAEKMMYGAVAGMTAALDDPYTSFLPPDENQRSKEDLSGEFGGVGISLGYIDKTLAVMAPLPNNPAIKVGIKAGDLILHIKDEKTGVDIDTVGIGLLEAVNSIRGERGTPVTLTILHEGANSTEEIEIVRDTVVVASVELEWVGSDGKTALIRLMKFGERTLPEWKVAVDEILDQQATGVIVDFRNNPGGYLQRAIDLVSDFIPDGVVVQQRGKDRTETFTVNRKGRLIGMPVVALVNRGSASASEIMAGAMRDRLGVQLVGERTFGKGTVQEAQDLISGAGLHVTIAEWLLPSGDNIHGDGLEVDVEVKDDPATEEDEQVLRAIEVLNYGIAKI
ncbi:S41 family peptidase [Patescibacteria group bacterium]|nr:S41 family peptidase [Patescibacteria group bacterium]